MKETVKIVRVKFNNMPNGLPFLDNDIGPSIGDKVIVEDQASAKEVIAIEEYETDNLPWSLNKLKKVLRIVKDENSKPVITITIDDILRHSDFLSLIEAPANEVLGRDKEIQMLAESMYKKRMKNNVLVGPAGCGKTAIIEAFAERVADDYYIVELNQGSMISGTRFRGDYEEKIVKALDQIIEFNENNQKKIILFIDEIHTIVCEGASNSLSAGDIIKTYLSKMKINVIGATTNAEYEKYLAHDAALCRRLSPIFISELSDTIVIGILDEFAENEVDKTLLEEILAKSKTLKVHSMPDTPLEILDRCLARQKYSKVNISKSMIDDIVNDMNGEKGKNNV